METIKVCAVAVMASDHHSSVMCGYWNIEHNLPDLIYSYQATRLLSYRGQNNVSYNLSSPQNRTVALVSLVRLSVLEGGWSGVTSQLLADIEQSSPRVERGQHTNKLNK